MRIIAGTARGRKLHAPKGSNTRPTSDRVREAVFSIVGDLVAGAKVLDLFAGTGAMGLEALSRGAREAVFVESDPAALRCLNLNIEQCRYQGCSTVKTRPVLPHLGWIDPDDEYELVFVDPPYRGDLGTLTLLAISKHVKPSKRCLIVVEHASVAPPEPLPHNLGRVEYRKYGNTGISFLEFNQTEGA